MNTKKILEYAIWTGIYATLVIPFVLFSNMFFPYITGKAFAFRIIVEIIFGLWLILMLKEKAIRVKFSWIILSAMIFTGVLLIADIFAVAPHKAFWSNFERMEGWVTIIHLLMYLLVLGSMLNKEKLWRYFFRTNLIAGSIMAVLSISEGIKEGVLRFAGPLGNPIYIAVYFLFILFFTLVLLYKDVMVHHLRSWGSFRKIFTNVLFYLYTIVTIVSLFVMYRTSRGALLGAIGGIFVGAVLVAIFEKERKVFKQLALVGVFVVVATVVVFLGVRESSYVKSNPTLSRFAEISWSNVNGQARQLIWPIALEGYREKPVLGWGQEGFNYVFNKYYDPRLYGQESWFDRAHNAPLDFLIAGGILGLLSYLALFTSSLYLLWFKRSNFDIIERAILTGIFAGYLFQAIFVFDNLVSYIMFFTTLAYVHSRSVNDHLEIKSSQDQVNDHKDREKPEVQGYISIFIQNEDYQNYILIPLIVILTAGCVWWVNVPSIRANHELIRAIVLTQSGRIPESIESYKKALSYKSIGDSEIREQLLTNTPKVLGMSTVDQAIKKEFLNLTVNEVENQIALTPNDARYYILIGALLNNIGFSEQALPYVNKAVELSPEKQMMRFQLIQTLYALGRIDDGADGTTGAITEARKAYELDKRYDQAKEIYKTIIQKKIENTPAFKVEGQKLIQELESTDTNTNTE